MTATEAPLVGAHFTLATDLDGTFAGGSPAARAAVVRAITASRGRLIYVTGRGVDSWRRLAHEAVLPAPHVAITDVGTAVTDGATGQPVAALEARLARRWPGGDAVRQRLKDVAGIVEQVIDAPRRVSYELSTATLAAGLEDVRARLGDLDVELVGSAERYIDVLPGGVNKGTTLLAVLEWLGLERADTVVAGDSLNDLALFETGLRGIVVGNAEPELKRHAARHETVFVASAYGADGIVEGLAHFGLFPEADDG